MFLKMAMVRPREDQPEILVFFPWRKKDCPVWGWGKHSLFSSDSVVSFYSSNISFKEKKKKTGDDKENSQIVQVVSCFPVGQGSCLTHSICCSVKMDFSKGR